MDLSLRLAARTRSLAPSPIRKLVPLMRQPGMISLGGGYPNPGTFAFDRIEVAFRSGRGLSLEAGPLSAACQYGPTACDAELEPLLRRWHAYKDGVQLGEAQLQVLNGSQEGLHIMGYLFLEPGDCVALSEPSYPGATAAFAAFSDNFMTFPIDEQGTVTSVLEQRLEQRRRRSEPMPKFLYEVPNGHNPGGVGLSLERRKELLRIARTFDLLVLEDDPYQLLQLENRDPLPTLQSLDTDNRVVRLDSFSKIFAPGLRLGYATGPADVLQRFALYKQGLNLHTSSMVQTLLAAYLSRHEPAELMALIRENCQTYRRHRDAMVEGARKHLPPEVRYDVPKEGMFVWFRLPEGYDAQRMMEVDGLQAGVLLVPGPAFSPSGGLRNCMRASFSMVGPEAIEEGMRRFGTLVENERKRHER